MSIPDCLITRHLPTDFAEQYESRRGQRTDPLRVKDGYYMGKTYKSPASAPSNTQSPRAER